MENYYECKRCFYKSNKLSNIKSHLNKAKKCERISKSFQYEEDKLYELSLVKNIYNDENKKYKCDKCGITYSTNGNLKRHMSEYCKGINKNVIVNNSNVTNIINNNITNNINIQILNPFNKDSKWSINHIDINEQYDILKNKLLYSNTLEKILENDTNLNVLIKKDKALVYNNDTIETIDLQKLVRTTIEKLNDTIFEFGDNIKNSEIDKNLTIIKEALGLANEIFNNYLTNNNDTKNKAKTMFTNIYKNKSEKTEEILKKITNTSDIEIDKSDYF
jgi:hypothetical protein